MAACLAMVLVGSTARAAQSRAIIPFQGAVVVKPGQPPLDANPYGAKFQIYDQAGAGSLKFEDIQPVQISNGVFSVELGGGATPLDPALARDNPDLWLDITIDLNRNGLYESTERLAPRIHLGAAPFALYSAYSGATAGLVVPAQLKDAGGTTRAEVTGDGVFISNKNLGTGNDGRRGAHYRDNACIAWGVISSDGDLLAGFGIREVDWDRDNARYEIRLFDGVVEEDGEPAYSINVTALDAQQRPEVAVYESVSTTRLRVTIFGLDSAYALSNGAIVIPRVQSIFSIAVFGRPAAE